MGNAVERPIFIIGAGRSGTTIFYELLAGHRHLGWFSSYMQRFPNLPWLAGLNPLYQIPALAKRFHNTSGFPRPSEAHLIWDKFHPMANSLGGPPLTEQEANAADTDGLYRFIRSVLRFSGRERFMNKNTRNTRRSRYLRALFPDAYFIHVIRDGRAVTSSLLKINWWPTLSLWWAGGKTPTQLEAEGMDPVLVAARNWKMEMQRVLQDKEHIAQELYMEIRYEKLMQDPATEMKKVLDFCKLPWTSQFQAHIQAFDLISKNFKWGEGFKAQQIVTIEEEIGPLLKRLGYGLVSSASLSFESRNSPEKVRRS